MTGNFVVKLSLTASCCLFTFFAPVYQLDFIKKLDVLYSRHSQPGVRVPLVVHEHMAWGTWKRGDGFQSFKSIHCDLAISWDEGRDKDD